MKKQEIELLKNPINEFVCCGKTMVFTEFKEHLRKEHNLIGEEIKGKRNMLMHIDGDYWYSSSYQWELEGGLKFTQNIKNARPKNSPMRY